MSQSFMAEAPMAGLVAQGPLPAGMLRIHQGNLERYVWPVHLPGWLALGWQVAGPSSTATEPLPQAVPAPAVPRDSEPEPTAMEKEHEPASGRGKRGRRRREEEAQPPAAVEVNPAPTGADTEQLADADSEPYAAIDPAAETAAEPVDDSTAEGAVALSALPDDLFDDPLN
ncbi:MAG: hypothetical protein NTV57_06895 [Cyanobacteria bacterium]|nr:hypothetical protein [Cyanobacteriota bacterium]